MSFKEYVIKRRVTNTPAGDFIIDAKKAGGLEDIRTLQELNTYLTMRGACGDAIIAGRSVWRGYCAAKQRAEIMTKGVPFTPTLVPNQSLPRPK